MIIKSLSHLQSNFCFCRLNLVIDSCASFQKNLNAYIGIYIKVTFYVLFCILFISWRSFFYQHIWIYLILLIAPWYFSHLLINNYIVPIPLLLLSRTKVGDPKYSTMSYWLFWIRVTWKGACAKRVHGPSFVSLNTGNKSPMWKVTSLLYIGAERDTLISRVKESRAKKPVLFTNSCPNSSLFFYSSIMSTQT